MASISTDAKNNRIVQFIAGDGKRRSIRLGPVSMADARDFKRNIEAIQMASALGQAMRGEQQRWLAGMEDWLYSRIAGVGLVAPRAQAAKGGRLDEFLADYLAKRTGKPRTLINRKAGAAKLLAYFDPDTPIASITAGMADDWLVWMKSNYADGTTARIVKFAKEFFRYAERKELVVANPFADLKGPKQNNEERKVMVSREDTQKILDKCPDAEWRLIVALARYAGLRVPSETLVLAWDDILWDENRFICRAPKTGIRIIPIVPELLPYLEACYDAAPEGAVHVIAANRTINPGTRMRKIIARAGLVPYTKPFHNLRATRQTELAADYPLHVVCAWLGNTEEVARKHYLKVRESDFEKAATVVACSALQKAVHETDSDRYEPVQTDTSTCEKTREKASFLMNSREREKAEYTRRESNPQPMVPKTIALSS